MYRGNYKNNDFNQVKKLKISKSEAHYVFVIEFKFSPKINTQSGGSKINIITETFLLLYFFVEYLLY